MEITKSIMSANKCQRKYTNKVVLKEGCRQSEVWPVACRMAEAAAPCPLEQGEGRCVGEPLGRMAVLPGQQTLHPLLSILYVSAHIF